MLGLIDRWSLSSESGSSQTNIVDMLSSTGMGGSLSYKGCGRGPVEPLFSCSSYGWYVYVNK